jgi:hypothetical protein
LPRPDFIGARNDSTVFELTFRPLINRIKCFFAVRHHLKKLICFIAGIVAAPAAIDNAFFLPALSYGADIEVADGFYGRRQAAVAVDILRLKRVMVFGRPFCGDFFPHFVVVFLRGDICPAVRANQSTVSYHFSHFPFSFFYFLLVFLRFDF